MTSSPVTGAMMPINGNIGNITRNTNKTELSDFKSFMNQSQQKLDFLSNKVSARDVRGNIANSQAKDVKADDKVVAADDKLPVSDRTEVKSPTNDQVEDVKKVVEDVKETVKDEFDITDEELENVLETLGLTVMALLDSDLYPAIVAKITGMEDTISIAMDADAYESMNRLTETVNNLLEEVAAEIDVPVEEIEEAVKSFENIKETVISDSFEQKDDEAVEENSDADETFESKITIVGKANDDSKVSMETESQTIGTAVEKTKEETDLNKSGERRQEHHSSANNAPMNFVENLMNKVSEALNTSESEVSYTSFDANNIMNQITESIKIDMSMENPEVSLRLHPETLGTVSVKISANNEGVLTAQFITQNEGVKAIIESQAMVLRESLEAKGVTVEAVEVLVESHEFDRNLNGENRGNTQNENSKGFGRRTRRINLMDDEIGEMTEEDNLAKEIMVQNGNTVDYSA